MIEIDVPTDIAVTEDDGLVCGRMRRDRALLKPGEVVIAGQPDRWSWARVRRVEKMTVAVQLITEQEAASEASLVGAPSPSADWPWPRLPWLRLEQHTFTSLDLHTFMWVDHFMFSIDATLPDEELLSGLLTSADYAHDFASPYRYGADVGFEGRPIHARWLADMLTLEMFAKVEASEARQAIHSWMDDEMLEPPQTARTHARVDAVLDVALGSGEVYRLDVPEGEELMHEYGGVVGATGYQEYVTIDRVSATMHLVVASDD